MITEQKNLWIKWLQSLGCTYTQAPDSDQSARTVYRQVVLREHLLAALEQATHAFLSGGRSDAPVRDLRGKKQRHRPGDRGRRADAIACAGVLDGPQAHHRGDPWAALVP